MPTSSRLLLRGCFLGLQLALGGLFILAGLSKLGQTLQTLAVIYSYQIVLPDALAQMVAHILPPGEILLGVMVIIGWRPRVTLTLMALLLSAFTVLTAQAWWRGLSMDCGCFDWNTLHPSLAILSTPGGATLRNVMLLALVGTLAWLQCQLHSSE